MLSLLLRMTCRSTFSFFAVLFLVCSVNGYRILGLFPHPGLSHFKVFHPIMRGLAEAGHYVTVVSYFPDPNPVDNYHDLRFEGQEILTNAFNLEVFSGRSFKDNFQEFFELAKWGMDSCNAALTSPAIDEIFKIHQNHPYDLVVMEYFSTDCMAGVSWMLEIPFVGLSSCALMPWHYDRVGLPDTPSYIPSEFSTFSESMAFWERVENWIVTKAVKLLYRIVESSDNRLLREKFPGVAIPDVREIVRNTSLILVNQHYTLSGARPLVPAVLEIGGVHIGNAKPLPQDLQSLLNEAHEGVIVVSFGSVLRASSLPKDKRNAMIGAFKDFNHKILWKWETNMDDQPKNVFIQPWLPQRDVLCHGNVRLFVSHGGLLGISEAVHCGVPVVVMPIYGDQFLNAAALVNRGSGVRMAYESIENVSYVKHCITEGLSERKREMARKLSTAYRNRPQTPLDLAIWAILNVIENGVERFERSYGATLLWVIYYSLDVILVLATVIAVMTISLRYLLKYIFFKAPKQGKDLSSHKRRVKKKKF